MDALVIHPSMPVEIDDTTDDDAENRDYRTP